MACFVYYGFRQEGALFWRDSSQVKDWIAQVICVKQYEISYRAFEIWDLSVALLLETRLLALDRAVKHSIGIFVTHRVGAFDGIIRDVWLARKFP